MLLFDQLPPKNTMKRLLALAFVGLILVPFAAAQDSVLLRLNLTAGKVYRYQTKTTMTQSGGPMSADIAQTIENAMTIERKIGADYLIANKILKASSSSKNKTMADMIQKQSKQLVGMVVRITYDARGNSKSAKVDGGNSQSSQMVKAMTASNIGMNGIIFPEKAVRVGDTWKHTLDWNKLLGSLTSGMGFSMKFDKPLVINYKLTSVDRTAGKAGVLCTIKGDTKATINGSGQSQQFGLSMDMKATMSLDLKSGMILSSQTKSNLGFSMGGGSMKMSQTQTANTVLVGK